MSGRGTQSHSFMERVRKMQIKDIRCVIASQDLLYRVELMQNNSEAVTSGLELVACDLLPQRRSGAGGGSSKEKSQGCCSLLVLLQN